MKPELPRPKLPFWRQKTTWAGIATIVTAIGGVATGGLTWAVALPMISTALIGIFLRQGIEKTK